MDIMKRVNVSSLFDRSADVVADKWTLLFPHSQNKDGVSNDSDPDEQSLPTEVVENLLVKLSEKGKLDDKTLSTFQAKDIKHVHIPDASRVTVNGLRVFKSRCLQSVRIRQGSRLSLDDILSCLGSETQNSLEYLELSTCDRNCTWPFGLADEYTYIFKKLVNIRSLVFVNIKLSNSSLRVISENLRNLHHLDISRNEDISDISPLRDVQLQTLIMYGLYNLATNFTVGTLRQLNNLERLDVSLKTEYFREVIFDEDNNIRVCRKVMSDIEPVTFKISSLLKYPTSNPDLNSLDVSGRGAVSQEMLRAYVEAHPHLRFLGLGGTQACGYSMFDVKSKDYIPGIVVSGNASLDQFAVSLSRYYSRDKDIVKCLMGFIMRGRDKSNTSDKDNILQRLLQIFPTDRVWSEDTWGETSVIVVCLHHLLTNGHVSSIAPDTVQWIRRACDCLHKIPQPRAIYEYYYDDILRLAGNIICFL